MTRIPRRSRVALLGVAVLAVGCAGPYDKPSTSTYILGAIFILIGIVLAYELIVSS